MSSDVRSISFVMSGSKNLDLLIHVEEAADGSLHFSYEVDGKTELRGLFFDFNNDAVIDNLVVSGSTVTNQQVGNEAVSNLKDGNNMQGTKENFDVGMTFGTSGKGKDLTTSGEFVLSASDGTPLTLDDIANVTFGARFSSVGLKLVSISPAAPDANDDLIVTDEDSATDEDAPNANLISNDTDADGDTLTVVAVNSNDSLVGNEFTLSTGGLITVNSDGSFDLNPNGAYEDLAVGETREDSITYRITDELVDANNQGFDTATANIIIHGVNDAPIISVGGSDSAAETVIESNSGLSTGGTLTVHDVDLTDVVEASVVSVVSSDNDSDPATPNNTTLHGMLTLNPQAPAPVLDDSEDTDTLSWTFDSGNEAFDYLATDEYLTLDYTVRALDDNGAYDDQTVTITIDGTNDAPIAANDSADTIEDHSVTLSVLANDSDVDTSDVLSVSSVGSASNGSVSISADKKKVIYTPNTNWSGTDNFTYIVSDSNGGFDTATATVAVEAVADVPDLAVSVRAGATVNDVVLDISSALTDTDGSESYLLDFSALPSGASIQGASGGQISVPSGSDTITLSLAEGVDFDFDFTVTAVSTEASNGDTAQSSQTIDIVLDSDSASEDVSFNAVNQSIWNTGNEFTFGDSRFLGVNKSNSSSDPNGILRSNLYYNVKAGFQSDLSFEGGDIDAEIPWRVNFQTDYNRTTDVLTLDTSAFLLGGGSFNTVGPSLEYELDFVFNYDVDTDVRLVVDFGSIDFEVVEFDLGSLSKTIFNFDKSANYTTNLIDYDSVTSGGLSVDFPYGITGTIEWPNLVVNSTENSPGSYSGNGASNNALNVNLDIDQALADIFLGGKNPFDLSANLGVAGGYLETLDVDVAAGFNFLQAFQLNAGNLAGTVIFEDNSTMDFNFGDELIFTSASVLQRLAWSFLRRSGAAIAPDC